MADKVLDSWEDMIDENEVLDRKLNDLKVNETMDEMRPNVRPIVANDSNSCIDWSNSTDWPSIAANNTLKDNSNPNSIRILKRPTNSEPIPSRVKDLSNCVDDSNQTTFCPQITLEDNTRTQYVPQVRILKRPNHSSNKDSNDKSLSNDKNTNKSQSNNKTYEEREAEYAKARLRILGSASAPEEPNTSSQASTPSSASVSPVRNPESRQKVNPNETTNNVPILRLPLGPDGTKGFSREPSSQQR